MKSSTTLAALVAHCRKLARRQHTPDAQLLRRFVEQREAAAFEELVERYAPLAIVVVGGMLTTLFLTRYLMPVLYNFYDHREPPEGSGSMTH